MFDYCLFLAHWSAPEPTEVASFLFIFVFSVLVSLERSVRVSLFAGGMKALVNPKNRSPANSRAEAICDGVCRKAGFPDQQTDKGTNELCECGELLQ